MALIRVAQYNSTPTLVTDYQAQNAHLQAFTNQLMTQQFILDSGTDRPVIKQGCYVSHGGSLYIADADTAITGSPADGSVYIRVSGTTSLTVEFVTDISGYTWNPVYTALTSGSYTLLPYLIVKASTVWTRYNFNPNNQQFGAITCTSVDTGQGATEVHLMNQNLRTTDNVSFANINPPVDNSDISIPSIGKGGFTYAVGIGQDGVTLPSGGTYVVVALTIDSTYYGHMARLSGGTHKVFIGYGGDVGYLIMRIA
jgi:hypothetical protein